MKCRNLLDYFAVRILDDNTHTQSFLEISGMFRISSNIDKNF